MSSKIQLILTILLMFPLTIFAIQSDYCQNLQTKALPAKSSQLIVVKASRGSNAKLQFCELKGEKWQSKFKTLMAVQIGKNGMAAIGEKKEGDLKTPAGLYPIGTTFGTKPLALKMDFKFITKDDKFIDDSSNKHYNKWRRGPTDAKSFETMLIKSYTYGAVIEYNMHPIIPGAGSAIFIHLGQTPKTPTAGCIAMEKKQLIELLQGLNKEKYPYILIEK